MHRFRGDPWTSEWLELTAAKVARSVLRGRGAGNGCLLPDENIQTLKLGGYHLEHNFGHGTRHLSNLLASLNILAFLLHTALELLDARYRTLRFRYGSRVSFFQELTTLLNWFIFENWDHVIAVMFAKLRVDTS